MGETPFSFCGYCISVQIAVLHETCSNAVVIADPRIVEMIYVKQYKQAAWVGLGTDGRCYSVLLTAHYTSVQTKTATACYRQLITPRYRRKLPQRATDSSLHVGTDENCHSVLPTAHYTSVQTNTVTACY